MPPTITPPHHLKILMLHGFAQSGAIFHAKTKALEKTLSKAFAPTGGITLFYPTGPCIAQPADFEAAPGYMGSDGKAQANQETWGWWIRKGEVDEECVYTRMDEGFVRIAEWMKKEGPFDGVIGFSQGACAAGMVASLLEEGRRKAFDDLEQAGGMSYPSSLVDAHKDENAVNGEKALYRRDDEVIHPPLHFAVSYSGFRSAKNKIYDAFYEPKISTPMLHFIGTVDTVLEEERSLRLVERCVEGKGVDGSRLVYHPGGHFLPSSQKQYVGVLIAFIKDAMGWTEKQDKDEQKAEDMDMPF